MTIQPLSLYQQEIARHAPGHDPRHVEAYMRLEYGTLDHLSTARFAHEARVAATRVEEAGPEQSEALAVSMGL